MTDLRAAEPTDEPIADSADAADGATDLVPDRGLDAGLHRGIVVAAVLAGVAVRAAILFSPLGRADSDEVITALMARHIAGDGFPVYFWGQHYGGTIEVLPVLVSTKIFGWSIPAMRVPNLILVVTNAALVWRLGRRWLTESRAQLAGLLVWVAPPASLWWGLHAQLFYTPTITIGLVLGLAAHRVRADGRIRDFAVLGLALGIGAWTSTNVAYFVVPAAAVVLVDRRLPARWKELLRGAPIAVAMCVVGAWPMITDYVESGGESMRVAVDFPVTGTYSSRLQYFFTEGLPGALGFRAIYTHDWIAGTFGVIAYLVILGAMAWSLRRSWSDARRGRSAGWAAIGLLAFPFIYAAVPFAMNDGTFRYVFFVVPFVALVLARVVGSSRAAAIVLVVALVVSVVGLQRLYVISEVDRGGDRVGGVGDLAPAIDVLEREGIDAAYGDYWVAYRLTFESDERVIATSSSGVPRYEPYSAFVRASPRSAWVVDAGTQLDTLTDALGSLDVGARVIGAGELAVVIPDRPVDPMEVPEEARRRA